LTGHGAEDHAASVRIVATPEAVRFVRERGGVLYVWSMSMEYGYHPVFVLEASLESPGADRTFQRFEGEGIELLFDPGPRELPDSVHLDVTGVLRKRVRASWEGHSFTSDR
jgi:hypothetical protein